MRLSVVFATTITTSSRGIVMHAMIQYFRPPKADRPSMLTIEIARLKGAKQRAIAVKLDAFAPSVMPIDANKAGIALSVLCDSTANIALTSLASISTRSNAFAVVFRLMSASKAVMRAVYAVILRESLCALWRIRTGLWGSSQKSCSSWSSKADVWISMWKTTVFQRLMIKERGPPKWSIIDLSNGCFGGNPSMAEMLWRKRLGLEFCQPLRDESHLNLWKKAYPAVSSTVGSQIHITAPNTFLSPSYLTTDCSHKPGLLEFPANQATEYTSWWNKTVDPSVLWKLRNKLQCCIRAWSKLATFDPSRIS